MTLTPEREAEIRERNDGRFGYLGDLLAEIDRLRDEVARQIELRVEDEPMAVRRANERAEKAEAEIDRLRGENTDEALRWGAVLSKQKAEIDRLRGALEEAVAYAAEVHPDRDSFLDRMAALGAGPRAALDEGQP